MKLSKSEISLQVHYNQAKVEPLVGEISAIQLRNPNVPQDRPPSKIRTVLVTANKQPIVQQHPLLAYNSLCGFKRSLSSHSLIKEADARNTNTAAVHAVKHRKPGTSWTTQEESE